MASAPRVRKIALQGAATWHCIKGDFAHAARLSCHDPAMSRCRRPKIEGGIHRYVKNALLPADWGRDLAEIEGRFGD
jgi:hypothetical protein